MVGSESRPPPQARHRLGDAPVPPRTFIMLAYDFMNRRWSFAAISVENLPLPCTARTRHRQSAGSTAPPFFASAPASAPQGGVWVSWTSYSIVPPHKLSNVHAHRFIVTMTPPFSRDFSSIRVSCVRKPSESSRVIGTAAVSTASRSAAVRPSRAWRRSVSIFGTLR